MNLLSHQLLRGLWTCLLLASLASCAQRGMDGFVPQAKVSDAGGGWTPWRLYTNANPYRALHVEIDAVAGAEPPQAWLNDLRATLAKHCAKPNGVRVVRSNVIPQSVAARTSSSALALRYIDGPPAGAAFIYVLYYNSSLNPSLKTANPHAVVFPYPSAIFVDRHYNEAGFGDRLGSLILQHEIGHLMGAARDASHGDGAHCHYRYCLMNPAFDYNPLRRFMGRDEAPQQALCPECVAELNRERGRPAPANLRFVGPVMVRNEGAYQVMALPNALHLHFGSNSDAVARDVLTKLRATSAAALRAQEGFILSATTAGDAASVQRSIALARRDSAKPVREAARLMATKLAP
jgi:hypothetical protein